MSLTATTELEAINFLLRCIGERPVTKVDPIVVTKASIARSCLRDTSREVQEKGWSFNKESGYPLTPDSVTNEIMIPVNALWVDPSDRTYDYANRGTRLYNRTLHTYSFTEPVAVEIIWYLPWEELPESAKKYIKYKAANMLQKQAIGSSELVALTDDDVKEAYCDFLDSDTDSDSPNMLKNIPALQRRINPAR